MLYTAPAGAPTILRGIHVNNTTAAAATLTLGVNSAGALAIANEFLTAFTVSANGTYDWNGFGVINASGTIRALQGTGSALTVYITGVEQA